MSYAYVPAPKPDYSVNEYLMTAGLFDYLETQGVAGLTLPSTLITLQRSCKKHWMLEYRISLDGIQVMDGDLRPLGNHMKFAEGVGLVSLPEHADPKEGFFRVFFMDATFLFPHER